MSRLKIALIVGGVVLVLLIGLMFAIGGGSGEKDVPKKKDDKIKLTYWRAFDDKSNFDQVLENWNREHENIEIDYKKLTIAEYEQTLLDALASGRGPDLFSVHNDWMPRYFDKLVPIPEELMSKAEYEKSFFPVAAADNIRDNRVYGIPLSIDSLALYYNTDLLTKAEVDAPPATWGDLVGRGPDRQKLGDQGVPSLVKKLNVQVGNDLRQSSIALGTPTVNRSQDIVALFMLQSETQMVNDNRDTATFNLQQKSPGGSPVHPGVDALGFYASFGDPGTANYSWNAGMGDTVSAFSQGKTAMMINYSYQIASLGRLNPNLHFNIAPVPQHAGRNPVNYASYWTEVVSQRSEHQKEAWEFIKFLTSREELRTYLDVANVVSSRTDVSSGGNLQVFYEQNKTAKSWYKGDAAKADQVFLDMINQVLSGQPVQNATNSGADQVTKILKQLKGQ